MVLRKKDSENGSQNASQKWHPMLKFQGVDYHGRVNPVPGAAVMPYILGSPSQP